MSHYLNIANYGSVKKFSQIATTIPNPALTTMKTTSSAELGTILRDIYLGRNKNYCRQFIVQLAIW